MSDSTGKYTIRIVGTATILTKPSEKEEAYYNTDKIIASVYQTWDNPLMEIFYISNCEIKYTRGFGLPKIIK